MVADLSAGKLSGEDSAHLDPDLHPHSIEREPGWRPIFGQRGAAQGHLRNNRVGAGDLFLFYGLFREAGKIGSAYCWKKSALPRHVIWGWLQVEEVLEVTSDLERNYGWMSYHPHFRLSREKNNVLYLASRFLMLPGCEGIAGSGTFTRIDPARVLSGALPERGASYWALTGWCHPRKGLYPLTYHNKMERWQRRGSTTLVKAVPRGQEFVLDAADYPEAVDWAAALLKGTE